MANASSLSCSLRHTRRKSGVTDVSRFLSRTLRIASFSGRGAEKTHAQHLKNLLHQKQLNTLQEERRAAMAGQQAQFAETIRAMKAALKRKAADSDSEASSMHAHAHPHTNRGHKLQRRAQFVRAGRLDDTGGLAHRRKISHAGYTRYIIASKPPLYDADGDLVSPLDSEDEEEEQQRGALRLREDAFGEIRLEHLLRPLTAAAELPAHPSLSVAYKSKALTQMTEEAREMVRRERVALWKAKRLLLRFRGDADWLPCEAFETEHDEMLLFPSESAAEPDLASAAPSVTAELHLPAIDIASGEAAVAETLDAMDGVQTLDMAAPPALNGQAMQALESGSEQVKAGEGPDLHDEQVPAEDAVHEVESTSADQVGDPPLPSIEQEDNPDAASSPTSTSGKDNAAANSAPSHAMTTRARARSPVASASASPTPSDAASIPAINPWFCIPPSALPDRDLALPPTEAEDTRRLILLYVQKQEQIVRSLDALYTGLQRADRLRHHIFQSCKAEGHMRDDGKGNLVTEMSDGEDWYDVEDLGLTARDLKVGKDGVLGLEKGKDEAEDVEEEGRRVGGRRRRVNRMG